MVRIVVGAVLLLGFCWGIGPAKAADGALRRYEPIAPVVMPAGLDPAKVALGRRLFLDPILSVDGSVSCAHCHDLTRGGVDGLARSVGVGGAEGGANAPTVYDAFLNLAQFWDGRADTLEEQVDGPLTNPVEMANTWPRAIDRLLHSPYRDDFRRVYGGDPTPARLRDAIATFERSLATVGSRFDRWLEGDDTALSPEELRGYELFKSYGCASCHQGAAVGGNMFQKFGFFGSPLVRSGRKPSSVDAGRYAVTGREEDRGVFKVPSLRLAVLTAPYFHDGSVASLSEAIRLMGRYQTGREIPDADISSITAFLGTLAGRLAGDGP